MSRPKSRGTYSPENPSQDHCSLRHDEKYGIDPGLCPVRYRSLRSNPEFRCGKGPSDAAEKSGENEKRLISDKSHQDKDDAKQEICGNGQQIRGNVRAYPPYQHKRGNRRSHAKRAEHQAATQRVEFNFFQTDYRNDRRYQGNEECKYRASDQNDLNSLRVLNVANRGKKRLKKTLQRRFRTRSFPFPDQAGAGNQKEAQCVERTDPVRLDERQKYSTHRGADDRS